MKIVNVQQGTQAWHDLRAKHDTASEAPAMAGVSKYQSRADLLQQKHSGEVPEPSPAQQRLFDKGHAAETAARPLAEEIIGEELFPVTGISEEHPRLLASLDGATMLEDAIFEHKLWNEELAAAVRAEDLPEHYKVQMDQQLLVSGAEKCLFMVSDGTRENAVWCWHYPDEARFQRLIAGWQQFRQDLADYQPQAQQVAAQGEAPEALPVLSIDLTGMVKASNLPEFKARALAMIEGIKTTLATDQDFADAGETVKFLQKGEKQLEASKRAALEQTASIAELFSTIDELRETMRQKRLQLDKLVKAEKENRRMEIQQKAIQAFDEWLVGLDAPVPINDTLDVAGAMKGKKTIATLQAAADDEVARAKVAASQEAQRLADNKALIEKLQGDYAFLFSDWRDLIQRDAEFIQLQIENRIAHHQQEEQKRLDAERERIRQEEEAKARRKTEQEQIDQAAMIDEPEGAGAKVEVRKTKPMPGCEVSDEMIQEAAIPAEDMADAGELIQQHRAALKPASQLEQPDTVTITRKEYQALLAAREKLEALQDAGVEKWSGYRNAIASLEAA